MYWTEFLTVALIHLLAVASPGPDFAIVVRESVAHGRRAGAGGSRAEVGSEGETARALHQRAAGHPRHPGMANGRTTNHCGSS